MEVFEKLFANGDSENLSFADGFSVGAKRAEAAEKAGIKPKMIDWVKLDKIIKEKNPNKVGAFLQGDRPCTYQVVYENGQKIRNGMGGYFGSKWATPMVEIDGEVSELYTEATKIDWGQPWPNDKSI